ncbi:hypothetical protein DFJ77DRAFT_546130 [Powellomyces hirtus]|nr:hypothetical protein DFJ77DRAFT_546130 [Powellomyces hirtus]
MGFLPSHSFSRSSGVSGAGTSTTATSIISNSPSRHPSVASSNRDHHHGRFNLVTPIPRLPPAPVANPPSLRRQGSDLSVAYSLGSHYNTPLKEAMASWEEALAIADGQGGASSSSIAHEEAGGGNSQIGERKAPGSRVSSQSHRHVDLSADLVARHPKHPLLPAASLHFPSQRSLGYLPRLSGSGSARTVMNDATSSALNLSTSTHTHPNTNINTNPRISSTLSPSPDTRTLGKGIDNTTSLPTDEPTSPSAPHRPPATRTLSASSHSSSTSSPNAFSANPADMKPKRRRRWLLCTIITIGLLLATAIVAALTLLTLNKIGVLTWTAVKDRIVDAAEKIANWFHTRFSPQVTTGGIVIIAAGSATVAVLCVGLAIFFTRHRAARRRQARRGATTAGNGTAAALSHLTSHSTLADLSQRAGKTSTFRSRTQGPDDMLQRSASSASLGLVHYNCDFILPSLPPLHGDGDCPTLPTTPAAAEPPKPTTSPHQQQRNGGGGGNVVQVLPAEASTKVRRVPTILHGTAAPPSTPTGALSPIGTSTRRGTDAGRRKAS